MNRVNDGKQRMFAVAMLLVFAIFLLTSCGSGDIVDDVVTDVNMVTTIVEQTVVVSTDMIHATAVEGQGAFSCAGGNC